MDKFRQDLDRWIEREQPDEIEEHLEECMSDHGAPMTPVPHRHYDQERKQPDNNGYPAFLDGGDLPPINVHKFSIDSDRCVCGGLVVYFEDQDPEGEGCEVEGKPWTDPNWCGTTDEYDYQEDSYDS